MKTLIKITVVATLFLQTGIAEAQIRYGFSITPGVSSLMNYPSSDPAVNDNPPFLLSPKNWRASLAIDAQVHIPIGNKATFVTGLGYINFGERYESNSPNSNLDSLRTTEIRRIRLNTMTIPLQYKRQLTEHFYIQGGATAIYRINIKSKRTYPDGNGGLLNEFEENSLTNFSFLPPLQNLDLMLGVSFGWNIDLGTKMDLTLEPTIKVNVPEGWTVRGFNRNYAFTGVSAGILF